MNNKISIAILTLNEEQNIKRALNSIPNNSLKNTIVLDGGSTDKTEAIARRFDIKFFSLPETSIERRRYEAIKNTNTEYICFLDADQYFAKNTDFQSIYSIFENNKNLAGVQFRLCIRNYNNSYWANGFGLRHELINKSRKSNKRVIGTPSIFRRSIIKNVAYQDNIKGPCDDTITCLRIREQGYSLMAIDNKAYESVRANFKDTINKALWYGRGDYEYVKKLKSNADIKNHLYHIFIRNLILMPSNVLTSKNFNYVFFFLIFGFFRAIGFLNGFINKSDLTSHKS